ncbi:MAG: outer membrane lipoprotein-sorting protein, partial [Planctomycetes bacterium]|nr:outer membrane lipoprotein-sorting protein [Planctomycetota bacterium]
DLEGKKYRVVEALEVKTLGAYPSVIKSRVQDLAGGGETVSVFSEIRYDLDLGPDIFTERSLRKPPKEAR